mgnify:CR=1 FL=1
MRRNPLPVGPVLIGVLAFDTAFFWFYPALAQAVPLLSQNGPLANFTLYLVWGVSILTACRLTGRGLAWRGFSRENVGRRLLAGLGLGCATALGSTLVYLLMGFSMDQILSASAPNVPALLLNLAWYLFLVGPAEELAFRGYLFHALSEVTRSPGLACTLTSLLFGAMHLRGGNLLRVASTALLGAIFTLPLLQGKRAMWASVSAHSAHNAALELLRWFFC